MISLSPDQQFLGALVMLLFLWLGFGPRVRAWLDRVDPMAGLDHPPKDEE